MQQTKVKENDIRDIMESTFREIHIDWKGHQRYNDVYVYTTDKILFVISERTSHTNVYMTAFNSDNLSTTCNVSNTDKGEDEIKNLKSIIKTFVQLTNY